MQIIRYETNRASQLSYPEKQISPPGIKFSSSVNYESFCKSNQKFLKCKQNISADNEYDIDTNVKDSKKFEMLPNQHPGFPAQSIGTVPFEKPVHKKIVSQTIICEVTHED